MDPVSLQIKKQKRSIIPGILLLTIILSTSCRSAYKNNDHRSDPHLEEEVVNEGFDNKHITEKEEKHTGGAGLELVISETLIHEPDSGNVDPSTEIHLTYWLDHYWALGLGYSFVFEEEGRVGDELAFLLSHKPWPLLTLNVGPSFALPDSEHELEVSAYFEGELNIKIGKKGLHTGPVLGSLIGKEFRWFGGIHIGYEF
ncbi:hypothetical protein GWK08_04055 [Leptobacterium flavescens]|uniref:Uncharacterized protein n=1 Tax=Leptobacterium flavescens TaxID=472055 RepID=A0A6P0UH18_9FLAO|nr:hypothetical protein [Leptobacterium flavescens]NER12601.1 hypothetical protein [Leptobacterium flavescens]